VGSEPIKAAVIGQDKMSDSLLKWVVLILERVQKYGWTLLIPDEPGVGQLCALVADARDIQYDIMKCGGKPRIISYAGNYAKPSDHSIYPKRSDILYEVVQAADLIIVLPHTKEIQDIKWWAQRKLVIEL
jgi:hypothetical protein